MKRNLQHIQQTVYVNSKRAIHIIPLSLTSDHILRYHTYTQHKPTTSSLLLLKQKKKQKTKKIV